jgi:hypothetical protein
MAKNLPAMLIRRHGPHDLNSVDFGPEGDVNVAHLEVGNDANKGQVTLTCTQVAYLNSSPRVDGRDQFGQATRDTCVLVFPCTNGGSLELRESV